MIGKERWGKDGERMETDDTHTLTHEETHTHKLTTHTKVNVESGKSKPGERE